MGVKEAYDRCMREIHNQQDMLEEYKSRNIPKKHTQFLEDFTTGMARAVVILEKECPEVKEETE